MTQKKQQLSTKINAYEALSEKHRVAVDMRIENYAYADIAANRLVGVEEQTVRAWFMRGGLCHAAYQEKRNQRMDERRQRFMEIETQLHEMSADAVLVLKQRLKKGSETAAVTVLALAGFSPIKKVADVTPQVSEELKLLRQIVDDHEATGEPVQAERQTN